MSRTVIPTDYGAEVRRLRIARGWSKARLARAVGCSRITIGRIEATSKPPGEMLVTALSHPLVLGLNAAPMGVHIVTLDQISRGPRARAARHAAGLSLDAVAAQAGVSAQTLSRFERQLADPRAICGADHRTSNDMPIVNDVYARALGFVDAADMTAFCNARNPMPWLDRIAKAAGRPRLPIGHRPPPQD